jgi:peptidyl-prolyl cis-trans isomerase B (cyclophilin B)
MRILLSLCAVTVGLGLAAALADEPKKETKPDSKEEKKAEPASASEVAILKTSLGELVLEFWPDVAPKTVENFKTLAKKGFYDGTAFHRIIDGFMIQGGDHLTKDADKEPRWGTGGPGFNIKGETNSRSDRKHVRGVISMAHSGHPDTAGSQFFICLAPAPALDGNYTTFGKVIKGDDVLTKLGKVAVKPNPYDPRHEVSRPVERVSLESVKIVAPDSVK